MVNDTLNSYEPMIIPLMVGVVTIYFPVPNQSVSEWENESIPHIIIMSDESR